MKPNLPKDWGKVELTPEQEAWGKQFSASPYDTLPAELIKETKGGGRIQRLVRFSSWHGHKTCFHCKRTKNLRRSRNRRFDQMLCPEHYRMARASAKALNREYWRMFGRRKSNASGKVRRE